MDTLTPSRAASANPASRPNPAAKRFVQNDSSHPRAALVAAYALGATWNERHFTKDRTWKGTDHAASLEPAGLHKLCRDLKAAWKCMGRKATDILPIEAEQRAKLKWGCYNK